MEISTLFSTLRFIIIITILCSHLGRAAHDQLGELPHGGPEVLGGDGHAAAPVQGQGHGVPGVFLLTTAITVIILRAVHELVQTTQKIFIQNQTPSSLVSSCVLTHSPQYL